MTIASPRPAISGEVRPPPAWVVNENIQRWQWRLGWAKVNHCSPLFRPASDAPWYSKYLASPHWRRFRGLVLILADFRCADCAGEACEVHHLNYDRIGHESFHDVVPVCQGCHARRHQP